MNVTICTSKQKIQSSILQYDDKSFQLLKWKFDDKDLTPQSGGEEFKSSHIGYLGYLGFIWHKVFT
jgi:hypothetical protein